MPAPTPTPLTLRHKGRADQGLAFIAWPTTGFYADPKRARALTLLADVLRNQIHGTPASVHDELVALVERTAADELLITMSTYDRADMLDSYTALAELAGG